MNASLVSPWLQMMVEALSMGDQVLDLRVQAALMGNRLVRLDNPVIRAKVALLGRKAADVRGLTQQQQQGRGSHVLSQG